MKKTILAGIILLFSVSANSQSNIDNYPYLVKDTILLQKILNGDYPHPAIEIGTLKPYQVFNRRGYPIKIAIDPGHIAGNKKEAILEERYINYQAGFFYESELTSLTAEALKEKLRVKGFDVMVTRQTGETSFGMSYSKWYRTERKKAFRADLLAGKISNETYEDLLRGDKKYIFEKYFKDADFINRGNKINAFQPDITLVIHYNASEFKNNPKTFTPLVSNNYSVAFVPGAFTVQELAKESQLEDFVRLASSDIISKSILLSSFIVDELDTKLGAPSLLPNDNPDLWYLKKYSVYTDRPGVYSRNLYMTRAIQSPICYAECLLQNNEEEIKRLANKDIKFHGKKVSSRVIDVSDACYSGIVKYFTEIGYIK